jgi:multiple sugar transport system substrate-binding protein
MINQNETVQKVSAAMASGTMPDALDVGLDLLIVLAGQGVFLPLDDLFASIGKQYGGWLAPVEKASNLNGRFGIPFGISGNMLLRRHDVLSKAGLNNPPLTWVELVEQAAKVVKPPFYPIGFCLGNAGDGNTQVDVLQSYGGRIADDSGKKAAIKSDATRTYLTWVKDAYDRKLFPPGVTTWDGAGDNNAYAAGTIAFAASTGSIGVAARNDDPELYSGTRYSSLPAGPLGVISPISPQLRAIRRRARTPKPRRRCANISRAPNTRPPIMPTPSTGRCCRTKPRSGSSTARIRSSPAYSSLCAREPRPATPTSTTQASLM